MGRIVATSEGGIGEDAHHSDHDAHNKAYSVTHLRRSAKIDVHSVPLTTAVRTLCNYRSGSSPVASLA